MKHKIDVCESCGAKIIWIVDQNGMKHPVNKTRVRVYTFSESVGWTFAVDPSPTESPKAALRFISHFVTCPNASSHSKGGR